VGASEKKMAKAGKPVVKQYLVYLGLGSMGSSETFEVTSVEVTERDLVDAVRGLPRAAFGFEFTEVVYVDVTLPDGTKVTTSAKVSPHTSVRYFVGAKRYTWEEAKAELPPADTHMVGQGYDRLKDLLRRNQQMIVRTRLTGWWLQGRESDVFLSEDFAQDQRS
jgi:hypothetical protein